MLNSSPGWTERVKSMSQARRDEPRDARRLGPDLGLLAQRREDLSVAPQQIALEGGDAIAELEELAVAALDHPEAVARLRAPEVEERAQLARDLVGEPAVELRAGERAGQAVADLEAAAGDPQLAVGGFPCGQPDEVVRHLGAGQQLLGRLRRRGGGSGRALGCGNALADGGRNHAGGDHHQRCDQREQRQIVSQDPKRPPDHGLVEHSSYPHRALGKAPRIVSHRHAGPHGKSH